MKYITRLFFVGSIAGVLKFAWYLIITVVVLIVKVIAGKPGEDLLPTMAIGFGISLFALLMQLMAARKEKSALKEMERLFNERNLEL